MLGKGCRWCAPGPTAARGRQNSPPSVQSQNQALQPVTFLPILVAPIPSPEIEGGLCPSGGPRLRLPRTQAGEGLGCHSPLDGVTELSSPWEEGVRRVRSARAKAPPPPHTLARSPPQRALCWGSTLDPRLQQQVPTTPLWPLSSPPFPRVHTLPWTPSLLSSWDLGELPSPGVTRWVPQGTRPRRGHSQSLCSHLTGGETDAQRDLSKDFREHWAVAGTLAGSFHCLHCLWPHPLPCPTLCPETGAELAAFLEPAAGSQHMTSAHGLCICQGQLDLWYWGGGVQVMPEAPSLELSPGSLSRC